MIAGLLLAAGESVRMGTFKQLLPLGGKTFVECCVNTLLSSTLDDVIVVTGHRDQEVRAVLSGIRTRCVTNPDFRSGMSSSIICGVKSMPPEVEAVVIALVDQPLIEPQVINTVIESYRIHRPKIVIPTFAGKNGHPVLIDLALKNEILSMDQSLGLREVVHAHSKETLRVEVMSESVVRDCDYPEDYEKIKNLVG